MEVIVYKGTENVFGPFATINDVEKYLLENGFQKVSTRHWANGYTRVHIKTVQQPIPFVRTDCEKARRLYNTRDGCGNDLSPESEWWLRNHLASCEVCQRQIPSLSQ